MMTKVYCKCNADRTLDFFVQFDGKEYFLFRQKKAYVGVTKYFKNGVKLDDAINHRKGICDHMINKVMSKLPVYIRFIEKEYGVALLEQSKRKQNSVA